MTIRDYLDIIPDLLTKARTLRGVNAYIPDNLRLIITELVIVVELADTNYPPYVRMMWLHGGTTEDIGSVVLHYLSNKQVAALRVFLKSLAARGFLQNIAKKGQPALWVWGPLVDDLKDRNLYGFSNPLA